MSTRNFSRFGKNESKECHELHLTMLISFPNKGLTPNFLWAPLPGAYPVAHAHRHHEFFLNHKPLRPIG